MHLIVFIVAYHICWVTSALMIINRVAFLLLTGTQRSLWVGGAALVADRRTPAVDVVPDRQLAMEWITAFY